MNLWKKKIFFQKILPLKKSLSNSPLLGTLFPLSLLINTPFRKVRGFFILYLLLLYMFL
ncbi:hypothetical protein bas60_0277 [Escherichia phage PaulScherrer]|nr:hypothetical protein bas60_0277 [Escherichia phage PaulScherrer]